jgi:hypothetical protein
MRLELIFLPAMLGSLFHARHSEKGLIAYRQIHQLYSYLPSCPKGVYQVLGNPITTNVGKSRFFWLIMGITGRIHELRCYCLSLAKGALYRWSCGSIKLVLRRNATLDKIWCRQPQKIFVFTSNFAEI